MEIQKNQQLSINKILLISIAAIVFVHVTSLIQEIDFNSNYSLKNEESKESKILLKLASLQNQKRKPRQIAQSEDSKRVDKNVEKKFLSDKSRYFDRQTAAKNIGKFKEAGIGLKNGIDSKSAQRKKAQKKKVAKKANLKSFKLSKDMLLEDYFKPEKTIASAPKGTKTGKKGKSGLSARNDHIEELPLGDFTKLNTTEYKYYGFFFRIKQKLEQFWGASIQGVAQKMFKAGRRLPANKFYITSLKITMSAAGEILNVDVDSTSGVRELDSAAIKSFNKAGPFPNPPRGLINNGRATINWKFAVDAN